jgi:hypothetical protein
MKFMAGGSPQPDFGKLKTAADLMRVLNKYIEELSKSDQLQDGPAPVLLSRLQSMNLERGAQQLDSVAKMPVSQKPD